MVFAAYTMVESKRSEYPPGYRFCPSDEELIADYLLKMNMSQPLPCDAVTTVELYNYHPQELVEKYKDKEENKCWYFLTPRNRKYKNGNRPNRATKEKMADQGFWKATGSDVHIKNCNNVTIGGKKTLVYYKGKPPKANGTNEEKLPKPKKTNWIMHEFRIPEFQRKTSEGELSMKLDDWVLCRIRQENKRNKMDQEESERQESHKKSKIDPNAYQEKTDEDNIDEEINKFMENGQDMLSDEFEFGPFW